MTIQIVKIEGDVAYLYDDQLLRVFKVAVEDKTGLVAPIRRSIQEDGAEGVLGKEDAPAPVIPRKRRPSIMPPGLRGVMLPAESPGAAIETRRV
jgi:hypothetical protein